MLGYSCCDPPQPCPPPSPSPPLLAHAGLNKSIHSHTHRHIYIYRTHKDTLFCLFFCLHPSSILPTLLVFCFTLQLMAACECVSLYILFQKGHPQLPALLPEPPADSCLHTVTLSWSVSESYTIKFHQHHTCFGKDLKALGAKRDSET